MNSAVCHGGPPITGISRKKKKQSERKKKKKKEEEEEEEEHKIERKSGRERKKSE